MQATLEVHCRIVLPVRFATNFGPLPCTLVRQQFVLLLLLSSIAYNAVAYSSQ